MDNVTHSLVGLFLAEAVIVWRGRAGSEPSASFRQSARLTSILTNNMSDLDFLYAHKLGGKLGYLMHHRGHTHTLPVALLLGLGVFVLASAIARRTGAPQTGSDRRSLLALCLAGPLFHISLDACNNYGVHPFWPVYDGWLYGDCLFIVEPWFWVLLVPALFTRAETRIGKSLLGVVLFAGLALAWSLRLVPWGAAVALTLGAGVSAWVVSRLRAEARLLFAAAGSALVFLLFLGGSRLARASVLALRAPLARAQADAAVDVAITPMPADPLCYSAIVVSSRGGEYWARSARVSVVPALLSAEHCRVQPTGLSLGLSPPSIASSAGVYWEGEWSRPLAELRELRRTNCDVAALLRFARVPFWKASGRERLFIGDLRFDRDPARDFDEFYVKRVPSECSGFLPPWSPPRSELLDNEPIDPVR